MNTRTQVDHAATTACSLARQIANYIIPPLFIIDLRGYALAAVTVCVRLLHDFLQSARKYYVRLRAAKLLLWHCACVSF